MAHPVGQVGWKHLREEPPPPQEPMPARSPARVARLVYLVAGLYALTFALFSILQHDAFRTNAFDLGNMDQAAWNTLQGRWFSFSNWEGGTSRLAAHVEPIFVLISQFYRLYSSPRTLLALQAVVLSLGALPVFWLARKRLRSDFAGACFAFAYLLTPSLQAAVLADFHPVTISASLLLFTFYFLQKRWYPVFLFFAILSMATKEEIPLSIALMGLYAAFVQKDRIWGLAVTGLSLAWAGVAFGLVIPAFNPAGVSPYMSRYDYLASPASPSGIAGMLGHALSTVMEEQRRTYLDGLFRPMLYLPLLSPFTLLLALPDLGINLLSNFPFQYSSRVHYDAPIVPMVTISGIFGVQFVARILGRLSRHAFRPVALVLAGLVLFSSLYSYYNLVFLPLTDHMPAVTEHERLGEVFAAMIPPDAAVSAGTTLNPHVSQRQSLFLFPEIKDAEYIFLDVSADTYPTDGPTQHRIVLDLLKGGQWGVIGADDGYLLLKKGSGGTSLPDRFFDFARVEDPDIMNQLNASFGPVRLLGYDVEPRGRIHGRNPYANLTLYWRATEAPKKDYDLTILLVSPANTIMAQPAQPAATIWYPASQWKPGEVIKVVMPRLPIIGYRQAEIQLGLVDGHDTNSVEQRIVPRAADPSYLLPLDQNQMLLKIATLRAD